MLRNVFVGLLWFASASALAETAYVTDTLRLGLHQAQDTSDRSFRTLESGQALEILNRDRNYAQVRLPDGAEGYVKAAYLVFKKPAILVVEETLGQVQRLQQDLADAKDAFAAPGATIASLEQQLSDSQSRLEDAESGFAEMKKKNENYRQRYDQFKYSLPLGWVGSAMAVCMLAGFLFGLWWVDRNNRKRHGGIRVY